MPRSLRCARLLKVAVIQISYPRRHIRYLVSASEAVPRGPWPTHLLKQHSSLVASFLNYLFNLCFHTGFLPISFKFAYITRVLKKLGLYPLDVKSYRPISNLSVISKLLERLVSKRLYSTLSFHNQASPRLNSDRQTLFTMILCYSPCCLKQFFRLRFWQPRSSCVARSFRCMPSTIWTI
jgi:hypothetical protein